MGADGAVRPSRPGGCRGTGHGTPGGVPRRTHRRHRRRGARAGRPRHRRSAPVRHHLGCPVRAIRDRARGRAAVAVRPHDLLGPAVRGRRRNRGRAGDQLGSTSGGLWLDANATTENGQPVVLSYTSSDGEVTVSAPSTWEAWLPGKLRRRSEQALDVWFGGLWRPEESFGSGERIELVDPVAYDAWCAAKGGSPLLSAPADAAAIAQQVIADPNFETTAPVAARIGGRRGRVDRRHPCPRRRGLRDRNDRDQPLDPHDRVGTRVAPASLPRRPPRGHVGSRRWRSRSWRPRSASTKSSPRPHRSSTRSSSTRSQRDLRLNPSRRARTAVLHASFCQRQWSLRGERRVGNLGG